MPFAIDDEKFRTQFTYDVSKPQGTLTGLPVKQIPHMEFPRVLYKHPKEPFRKIEHRNAQHEVVDVETVPAEHLTMVVNDAKEMAAAMEEGWVKEPYIQQAPPDPNANLYSNTSRE